MGDYTEQQYLSLVRRVIDTGDDRPDRTGTGTRSVFGAQMRFSLAGGSIPLLTTKRVFWKGIVEELLWFLSGSTDASVLSSRGVKVWDANGSRSFLDSVGLEANAENDLGPVYGFQWRHSGARYVDAKEDYSGQGVDQIERLVESIRRNPFSRRHILCAWNPADIPKMALPPCHCFAQFYVSSRGQLSGHVYQRSADLGLGIPFNLGSYGLLTHMLCKLTNTEPGELVYSLGDAHVYRDHIEALEQQLARSARPFPSVQILGDHQKSVDDFRASDFVLRGYNPHGPIAMNMSV